MIIKYSHIPAFDINGEPTTRLIFSPDHDNIVKTAAFSDLSEDLRAFIKTLHPENGHTYKLLTGLGAYEYWGQNRNGDRYREHTPWYPTKPWGLLQPSDKYGYRSFLRAGVFRYHKHDDMSKSLGRVLYASYNPRMHRVELVVDFDHALLAKFNSLDYLDIEYPEYSQASKVPWDRCSICNDEETFRNIISKHDTPEEQVAAVKAAIINKPIRGLATSRSEYCEHLLHHMNEILDNGQIVGAENDFPEFFDISQVHKGADVSAKELLVLYKSASLKKHASLVHEADIAKKIDNLGVPLFVSHEPELPIEELSEYPIEDILGTLADLGIVLDQKEFQTLLLYQLGRPSLADTLTKQGMVFPPSEIADSDLYLGRYNPAVARIVIPYLSERCCFTPFAAHRLFSLQGKGSACCVKYDSISFLSDILSFIARAYKTYRDLLIANIYHRLCSIPDNVRNMLIRLSGVVPKHDLASYLLGMFPAAYLYSAHLRPEEQSGPVFDKLLYALNFPDKLLLYLRNITT